jgi:hypothetical protein
MPVPGTAFLLEMIGGWLGFMGLGWIYAGRPRRGLVILVGWLVFVGIEALLNFVVVGVCRWPKRGLIPITSGSLAFGAAQSQVPAAIRG